MDNQNIGFGICCFGKEIYFKGTKAKLDYLLNNGHCCYVLTDNSDFFMQNFDGKNLHILPYGRFYRSYHDKISIVKTIHKNHDIAILLDADLNIKDYSALDKLVKFDYSDGVSYIDTLENHPGKFATVGEIPMDGIEWNEYVKYANRIYSDINRIETIWEYFIVFNKQGFDESKFFEDYERLQVAKEFCDVKLNKEVSGAGEGISIAISCLKNDIQISRDLRLSSLLNNVLKPITQHTPESEIPDYLK
jgi:hypothetical protein